MTGKRKRDETSTKDAQHTGPLNGTSKPMSAIAAARLKAAAPIPSTDVPQEPPTSPLAESSVSEAPGSEPEDIPLVPQNFKLSTWRKHGTNVLSDTAKELTIVLEKHTTASFVGVFDVKVLKGAVNINGANLGASSRQEEAKSHRVYVPSTHPITKIRGLDRANHVQLRSCRDPTPFADINPFFSDIWGGNAEKDKGRSFTHVSESEDDPLNRPLIPEHAPEDWLRTIDDIANTTTPSTTLTTGAPTSGKSTFARRLLNRYLTGFGKTAKRVPAICFLDLDASNPEYTPHGLISLTVVRELNFGPAFTHPTATPGNQHRNETVTVYPFPYDDLANYSEYYSTCVSHLFAAYQALQPEGQTPPLIINTPSEIYTSHAPVLERILTATGPSHIVHFASPPTSTSEPTTTATALPTLIQKPNPNSNPTLHTLTPVAPSLPPSHSPADLRAMTTQSYFHLSSPYPGKPLTHTPPHTLTYVPTPTRDQDVLGVLPLFSVPVPENHVLAALNGTVVHVLSLTLPILPAESTSASGVTNQIPIQRAGKSQIPLLSPTSAVPPSTAKYITTALITAIDPPAHMLHILVPRPFAALVESLPAGSILLVSGCCDVPAWAYVEDAYYQASRGGLGGEGVEGEGVALGPWVERRSIGEAVRMGGLNVARRVRRFLG